MTRRRPYGIHFESLECRYLLTRLVDLDSDGDLDVLAAGTWYENFDGYGNFHGHTFPSSDSLTAPGDLDGDGDIDVATADGWYENLDGAGTFGLLNPFADLGKFAATQIKLTDVGGNGSLDVVLRDQHHVVLYSDPLGRGEFEKANDFVLANLQDVGDIDLDGRLDAVVLEDGSTWVYRNEGPDGFRPELWHAAPPYVVNVSPVTHSVQLFDVDADGRLDVVRTAAVDHDTFVGIHFNSPSGPLVGGSGAFCEDYFSECRRHFGDFNQDGLVEVVVNDDYQVYVFTYDGTSRFGATDVIYLMDGIPSDLIKDVGDLNGDGRVDLLVGAPDWIDGVTEELHAPGTTPPLPIAKAVTFVSRTFNELGSQVRAVVDLNGNPQLDIIVVNGDRIEFAEFGGKRHLITQNLDGRSIEQLKTIDMDNDNDLDIVYSTRETFYWIENLGENQFDLKQRVEIDRMRNWAVGDVNGDQLTDVLFATRGAGVFGGTSIRLAINETDSLRIRNVPFGEETVLSLHVADVDADQDQDFYGVVGYWAGVGYRDRSYDVFWLKNVDGELSYERLWKGRPAVLRSTDVNHDGKADFIEWGDRGIVWRDGFFGPPELLVRGGFGAFTLADADNDGDTDLIDVHPRGSVRWHENLDGKLSFGRGEVIGHPATAIFAADLDGDRDTDFVSNDRSGRIVIYEGRLTGDVNNDGRFTTEDIVSVMAAGEFEDGSYRNSTFETGDWNGDREFNYDDILFAFESETYDG